MSKTIKERTIEFIRHKGIKMKTFEEKCGLSTGYVTSMRSGYGSEKLKNVLSAFPELNREWLLYGEGEMLNKDVPDPGGAAIVNNQVGNGNRFESTQTVERFLDELAAQRELTREAQQQLTKSQEQIDRLITIIEKNN